MGNSKNILTSVIIAGLLVGAAAIFLLSRLNNDDVIDASSNSADMSEASIEDSQIPVSDTTTSGPVDTSSASEEPFTYSHRGDLPDVEAGVVNGVDNAIVSTGTASAGFEDGEYRLDVTFSNLPDPTSVNFYEGWIVNTLTGDFLSTGELTLEAEGEYSNSFTSTIDYIASGHLRYVLTLEPNDNDPAPDVHIVEGDMLPL